MKTSIKEGKLLFVPMPNRIKNAHSFFKGFEIYQSGSYLIFGVGEFNLRSIALPPGNYRLVGLWPGMTEDQAAKIVDKEMDTDLFKRWLYKNYNKEIMCSHFFTALESFSSLMESKEIYLKNPLGEKEPEVNEPDPHSQYYASQLYELSLWQEKENRSAPLWAVLVIQ